MENTTMTSATQITRVHPACPQKADRSLTVGDNWSVRGTVMSAFGPIPTHYAPTHNVLAAKDVAYLRSWSPPV